MAGVASSQVASGKPVLAADQGGAERAAGEGGQAGSTLVLDQGQGWHMSTFLWFRAQSRTAVKGTRVQVSSRPRAI